MIKLLLALTLPIASAADFLPLANGNSWTYRDASTGSTFEVQASTPYLINGKMYHGLKGFTPQPVLARVNEYGNIVMWDQERELELLVTSFETQNVGQFEAHGRQCPASGKAQKDAVRYEGPAGRWSAAEVQFQPYGCADAGELSEQYVDNIGMVRRVVNTIAGPRTFDLVQARIGRQLITAGETGQFNMSVQRAPNGTEWQVTLRVDTVPEVGPKVRFSSGQEFDLRLRDAQGNVVWTWSATRLFVAAEHSISIGGWKETTTVPIPVSRAVEALPRSFTLEAWLTVAPGQPQFAAATTVELISPAGTASGERRTRR
jgi:hypothetical protein